MGRAVGWALAMLWAAQSSAAEPGGRADAPGAAAAPLAIRVENITVTPTHGPVLAVLIQRLGEPDRSLRADDVVDVTIHPPTGWKVASRQRAVTLKGMSLGRVTFPVEQGVGREENAYPVEVAARIGDRGVVHRQDVRCTTAPYFKPEVDGDPAEWKDAVPVRFTAGGKRTTVSTYWNRKAFALLVAVEEDALRPWQADAPAGRPDAVQVALSPRDPDRDGPAPGDTADRYEYLLVATGAGAQGKCFRLAEPDTKLSETRRDRPLGPLEYADARVAVGRAEGVTYYEASLPLGPMKDRIRPGEGREFYLSVLIHDPQGTGPRDLGDAPGLALVPQGPAWSRWQGAAWPAEPPREHRMEWGMSSAKY